MKRRTAVRTLALTGLAPVALLTGSCIREGGGGEVPFVSDWEGLPDMPWVGGAYWGNSLQDWEISNGKVVCNTSRPNRSLHLLTHQLGEADLAFEVSVLLQLPAGGPATPGVLGFILGRRHRNVDYRAAAVYGGGIRIGITTEGELTIGNRRLATELDTARPILLTVTAGSRAGSSPHLRAAARHPDAPETEVTLTGTGYSPDQLAGGVALLAHHPQARPERPGGTFSDWKLHGPRIDYYPKRVYGPLFFAQYTLNAGTLKMNAQCAPVDAVDGCRVELQFGQGKDWITTARAAIDPQGRTAHFRVENWDATEAVPYRLALTLPRRDGEERHYYEGTIAREPLHKNRVKLAVFSCNAEHGFPDGEVVDNVGVHAPDVAAFLGDQFYEATGPFGIQTSPADKATLDYLYRWYLFGWSYRELFRHIPSVCIPDDHDVYHGNVWGEAGKGTAEVLPGSLPEGANYNKARQDSGGYKMTPAWVNMVQRTQTGHLPDAHDPTPVARGIGVYYAGWTYGGISFAILEDRKFKSAPGNALPPEAEVINGFCQNPDFDLRDHPTPAARLLGDRQLAFLDDWVRDWSRGAEMKVVLSQTNFCTLATLPAGVRNDDVVPKLDIPPPNRYVTGDEPTQDMDSNGWPVAGRNRAVRAIRRAFPLHIAGDQHLASVVRYGVDAHDDGGYAFAGPALNNIWPRRWWPPLPEDHVPVEGQPPYTGRLADGFGNLITVNAVANPRQTTREPAIIYDRVTGYGIVVLDKSARTYRIECWPRYTHPRREPGGQYEGWPVTVAQRDNYGREPVGYLPEIDVRGVEKPVVEVTNEETGELVYALRLRKPLFRPHVFSEAPHTVRVSAPDAGGAETLTGLVAGPQVPRINVRLGG